MHALALYNTYINRVMAALVGVIVVSICLYIVFLLSAAMHAAGRSSAEAAVRSLSGHVAMLESTYLNETQALSREKATELGFVTPKEAATVFVNGSTALTLR